MAKYKKTKPPLQPRECARCDKLFIPEHFDHKMCSFGCALSKWDEAVAKLDEDKDKPDDGF